MSSSSPFSVPFLSPDQLSSFHSQGYLILPDFFSPAEISLLKGRSDRLLREFPIENHPRTIFRTESPGGQQTIPCDNSAAVEAPVQSCAEDYFLSSADQIHYFFEEKAFSPEGKLIFPKERSINKIGHALHVLDDCFAEMTRDIKVRRLARSLGFLRPIVLQSMIIMKQPRIGGLVTKHRDSTFLFTEPSSAIGFWLALEDCTEENGCLEFVPASHKDGGSSRRLQRAGKTKLSINNVGEIEVGEPLDGPDNSPSVQQEFIGSDPHDYPDSSFVPAPVKAGALILIHGDTVHASRENLSDKSRYIYTFHMIEGAEGFRYPSRNWLQARGKFPRLFSEEEEKEIQKERAEKHS